MRNEEKVMRERQVLINQITILAGIKDLAAIQFGYHNASGIAIRCDAAIQQTSEILRGGPDEPNRKVV